ncbi:M16 family metallopeptidase [Steroidobacter denitrificans]|uniref:M16 family metallopeptidase n=1 Tax=Steroidobacter denitrificans TaxID=465721 RepID=UPI00143AFF2E|nr:pitrilysin family protein [Steroidobacter denitrificans]
MRAVRRGVSGLPGKGLLAAGLLGGLLFLQTGSMAAAVARPAKMDPAASGTAKKVHIYFSETTLKNGLRVQLAEDHGAPVIALNIAYDVGSRNERKGLTGFAHLFEHLMFKGSKNVGDGEHFYQIFSNGGSMNGTTGADITLYFATLPANQLELALFLEADRMRSLDLTQEKLDNQRHAVQEERRLRVDNQPYGRADEYFGELFYDNFAYKHSTIGSMEDLNAASLEDAADFFQTYYAPNNGVLSLVGDFDSTQALKLIRKYFESIPRQPAPPAVELKEPLQTAERRDTVTDPLARLTQIQIAYKLPAGNTADLPALQVLSSILQGGQSSRLYQSLNKDRELVVDIGGFVDERIGPGGLYIGATLRPDSKPADVESAIYTQIDLLMKAPVAAWELQKAKNTTRLVFLQSIRSVQARATLLGSYTVKFGDPDLINTRLDQFDTVTDDDVQRVARRYLQARNRTVVVTSPIPAGGSAAAALEQPGA